MLTRNQRRAALGLLGFMLIGMVLETFGTGLVIPALGLITNKDLATSYPALMPCTSTVPAVNLPVNVLIISMSRSLDGPSSTPHSESTQPIDLLESDYHA